LRTQFIPVYPNWQRTAT